MLPTIYVLTWRYSDGSDHGVIRAFTSEADAHDLHDLLVEHSGTKQFDVVEVGLQEVDLEDEES